MFDIQMVSTAESEVWNGRPGNGLGTLLACHQEPHLLERLRDGASAALYHTAGLGTRLAPLPGLEGNSKGAVQLLNSTILEAVIRQTSPLAADRKGRLSVFWGDQLFHGDRIAPPTTPVEIFGRPIPNRWEEAYRSYGLLFQEADGTVRQFNKGARHDVESLMQRCANLFVSVGSFSLDVEFLAELLDLFAPELEARRGKCDTDPHFWMPLSLEQDPGSEEHRERMRRRFGPHSPLGVTQVAGWWDYGNLRSYHSSVLATLDAEPLQRLFGVEVRGDSILIDCEIREAHLERSVLVGVRADRVEARESVLQNVQAPAIDADGALLYSVESGVNLQAGRGDVQAGPFHTNLNRDGGADWDRVLDGNLLSYKELYEQNVKT